ncbi:hypothetical protein TCE0_038f12525 [Aspergillus terreus]|uniref:Uncharacterized protein n=1 Tax=Aspergillus terreus TaxID=33178 RepID=A0A5M3Z2H7_ASPTE|nr:hypothetical protein ATETN484_0005080100 [Aspergillus terreus]GFF17451.1 hypothetical protein TCE0_038f12525 [Aspergillus terreus]
MRPSSSARAEDCDLARPECSNCTRNGHVCRGYKRPRVFVNYAASVAAAVFANAEATQDMLALGLTRPKAKRWRVYVGPDLRQTIQPDDTDNCIVASPDSRPSERSQFLSRFLDLFCPDGYEAIAQSEQSAYFWIHELFRSHGQSAALDTAFSTLATTYIGESKRDSQLQRYAAVLHDRSLRDLAQSMGQGGGPADNNVLAAIMCMAFTEVFSPLRNREHGWIAHNKGACELIESRGTALLQTELGRNLFLRLRITGLYSAIGRRESFPLADRKFNHLSKLANANYFDYLIEEMMLIRQLLKDLTDIVTEMEEVVLHTRVMGIFARGNAIIRSLFCWLADLKLKYPHPCVWLGELADNISGSTTIGTAATSAFTGRSSAQELYSQHLGFPNLLVAQAMMHYWAAMIILLRCVLSCVRIVGSQVAASLFLKFQSGDCLGLPFPVAYGNIMGKEQQTACEPIDVLLQLADAIACSVQYCISPSKGAVGPLVMLWPLWVIKDLHANANAEDMVSQRKHEYCLGVFRGLMERGVKFSQPLQQYTPPK